MSVEVTGRVWGYADEVAWFERQMQQFVQRVQELAKEKGRHSSLEFAIVRRFGLGTRGWFTKRALSQTEYVLVLDTHEQGRTVKKVIDDLAARMS